MKNINDLINQAIIAGFDSYLTTKEWDGRMHEIMTCTKGTFSGDVIDIWYDFNTGNVLEVELSTQYQGINPTFEFK